jgi:hypothetical protein
MAQLYILTANESPLQAMTSGNDTAICGDCVLRGTNVTMPNGNVVRKDRVCYVTLFTGPRSTWSKFARGGYPTVTPEEAAEKLRGYKVRLGAYGDPTMLPFDTVETLLRHTVGHTGYTQQWRNVDQRWRHYIMASVVTERQRAKAREMGWRSYYAVPHTRPEPTVKAALCPAVRETDPLNCLDCLACAGTKGRDSVAVDFWLPVHGVAAKRLAPIVDRIEELESIEEMMEQELELTPLRNCRCCS